MFAVDSERCSNLLCEWMALWSQLCCCKEENEVRVGFYAGSDSSTLVGEVDASNSQHG